MPLNTQAIPPKVLASWTRTLRLASNLSQDALAEAAGVSQRTIQRVETIGRANQMTRRSIARGLGYDDFDIFEDPEFIATAVDVLAELSAEQEKDVEANHPDHIRLTVETVSSGAQIAGLIGRCDAWVFYCDDSATDVGQRVAGLFFDNVHDYGDIWTELPPSGRLEAQKAFSELLAEIGAVGLCSFQALRRAHFAPMPSERAPMPFNIGYLMVVPIGQTPSHILVPKRG